MSDKKATDEEMDMLHLVRGTLIDSADEWDYANTIEFDLARPDGTFTFRHEGKEFLISVSRSQTDVG